MADLEHELKELVVSALGLEDITADEIDSDEQLFVSGLGLDSIDGLELGMAIRKKYGIKPQDSSSVPIRPWRWAHGNLPSRPIARPRASSSGRFTVGRMSFIRRSRSCRIRRCCSNMSAWRD